MKMHLCPQCYGYFDCNWRTCTAPTFTVCPDCSRGTHTARADSNEPPRLYAQLFPNAHTPSVPVPSMPEYSPRATAALRALQQWSACPRCGTLHDAQTLCPACFHVRRNDETSS